MKKILALILICVMITGLFTACKKDDNKDGSSTVTSSGTTSGNSVFDAGASNNGSGATSSDDKTSSTQSGNGSGTASTPSGDTSKPSGNTNKPIGDTSKPSGDTSKPTGDTNKPSGDTSTPSGSTTTTPTMPAALKNLKGIEKYTAKPVDYSDASNWVSMPNTNKDVDVFFLYPTGYNPSGSGADELSDIDDSTMLGLAAISKLGQASVFENSCNIYMPKYRQLTIQALLKYGNEENMIYCASHDIYAALDYYFENKNNGKPFILAGHSQGSVWLTVILQDYMKKHPEYLKRMVAAYVIGYSITKDYLKQNTHLKFATGATDTGVIISYNTEGPGNKNATNIVVSKGSVAINPINWKTDGTKATVKENLGSLIGIGQIGPGIADAKVDTERGVVICTTVDKSMATQGFGPESYHTHDYTFYYANLQKNVADRIAAFKKK